MDDTEFDEEAPVLGFVQARLPWLVGAAMLGIYLLTLNWWVRLESLPALARATGWDWSPMVAGPLLALLTAPLRWLPAAVQPLLLNLLTAGMAALSVALLVRSIGLLTYDRTREARQRERSEDALLSIPLAWVPPVFGGLVLGLGLAFWEHATAWTGEMLDLLLFAWVVHSLLWYRICRRDGVLWQAALVFGVGMANNYAMIAFFPCFLVALIWIRGLSFFSVGFLGRLFAFGLAGLLLYGVLPAIEWATDKTGVGFWNFLRTTLAAQKAALLSVPPYAVFLLSFTSLLPVLIMGIRWPVNVGDTSAAGAALATFILRLVHGAMWVAALSIFFGVMWSPGGEQLGFGRAWLPLYFLAALAVGYYSGYLLLVFRSETERGWRRPSGGERLINGAVTATVLAAAAAAPLYLAVTHYPVVRGQDGRDLLRLGRLMIQGLPETPMYLISDHVRHAWLVEAALARRSGNVPHVMVSSGLLPYRVYHTQMERRFPERWPTAPEEFGEVLPEGYLADLVADLAASNTVFYLHPSFGYFFERVGLEPNGLNYRLVPLGDDPREDGRLAADCLDRNESFWAAAAEFFPADKGVETRSQAFAKWLLGRALNYWGVRLQRNGRVAEATPRFEQALRLDPENLTARANLEFNGHLLQGSLPELDLTRSLGVEDQRATWDGLIGRFGPPDHPLWCFRLGLVYAQSALFRQALHQFDRVVRWYPDHQPTRMWAENMEALTRLGMGQPEEALRRAVALVEAFPESDMSLETLTQVHMYRGDREAALAAVQRQLTLNPDNERALLNHGALSIQLKDFAGAIPPLSRLLTRQPGHQAARLNRAIAQLQSGALDRAREDYELLLKEASDYFAVHYGLGEIAYRQGRLEDARAHFRRYLEVGRKGTAEYREVEQRLASLGR